MIIAITGQKQQGKDTVAKLIQYYYHEKYCIEKYGNDWKNQISIESYLNNYPQEYYGENLHLYQIKKFASKLKKICSSLVGCKIEDFENEDFKNSVMPDWLQKSEFSEDGIEYECPNPKTYRWLLQTVGENMRNNISEDIWINSLFSEYKGKFSYCENDKPTGKRYEFGCTGCSGDGIGDCKAIIEFPNLIISDLRYLNEAAKIKSLCGIIIKLDRAERNQDKHPSEQEIFQIKEDFLITLPKNVPIEELCHEVHLICAAIDMKELLKDMQ